MKTDALIKVAAKGAAWKSVIEAAKKNRISGPSGANSAWRNVAKLRRPGVVERAIEMGDRTGSAVGKVIGRVVGGGTAGAVEGVTKAVKPYTTNLKNKLKQAKSYVNNNGGLTGVLKKRFNIN